MNEQKIRNLFAYWWSKRVRRYAVRVIGVPIIQAEYDRLHARLIRAIDKNHKPR